MKLLCYIAHTDERERKKRKEKKKERKNHRTKKKNKNTKKTRERKQWVSEYQRTWLKLERGENGGNNFKIYT
jgi:hypothetical protein